MEGNGEDLEFGAAAYRRAATKSVRSKALSECTTGSFP
jgi:hypothetical protein